MHVAGMEKHTAYYFNITFKHEIMIIFHASLIKIFLKKKTKKNNKKVLQNQIMTKNWELQVLIGLT